jgi:hypothetical protein
MSASFDIEVCRRLPLAEATFRFLDFVLEEEVLDDVFARCRGRAFKRAIPFALCVRLLADSLMGRSSAHQTFRKAKAAGSVKASVQAFYGKLRRLPIGLSLGLFDTASARLRMVGSLADNPLPASLADFWVLGFDGKKLKYVAHKLKELRDLKGNIFGGKLLVVQDMATKQALAVEAVADGEAADNPLVPGAVARVRACTSDRPRLWVADRAFCEFKTLALLSQGEDRFVIRYHAACKFYADANLPTRQGKDEENRSYQEEWGWLGKDEGKRVRVRKITVTRPGQEPFAIVTNLLDADLYPAGDLLLLYRERWGLEVMFQQVVQTFDLRHLIGATPQATVFQAVLCLLMYNITLTVRDIVAQQAAKQPAKVSLRLLFADLTGQLSSWLFMMGPQETIAVLRCVPIGSPEQLREYVCKILAKVWTERWTKAPTRKRGPQKPPRAYLCGGHSSVERILRGQHHEIPLQSGPKDSRTQPDVRPHEARKNV